ncbi:hypothetical protein SCP_1400570 [Sparassis crispa]|uniref:Uncharacterized protein n=1 Tax=Sparassis crispa TaxID=139825 RepID=A0A401H2M5_9APHY|nr:hypothetical protein SCP_1400570 [Sparassis crispa]GBE88652.1 hypothetical protein SCP_1400570 [Sparassis crispa]
MADTEDGHSRDNSDTATVIEEGTSSEHQHHSGQTINLNDFFANISFPFRFDRRREDFRAPDMVWTQVPRTASPLPARGRTGAAPLRFREVHPG